VPRQYVSFCPWESFDVQRAWKEDPEFRGRIALVRAHCEEFEPSTLELAAEVL
jgi:heme-degrading monooxygenase HmoA